MDPRPEAVETGDQAGCGLNRLLNQSRKTVCGVVSENVEISINVMLYFKPFSIASQ